MKPKLIAIILVVGLVPIAGILAIALNVSRSSLDHAVDVSEAALRTEVAAKLASVTATKRHNLESYLDTLENQILTFSENRMIIESMAILPMVFSAHGDDHDEGSLASARSELAAHYRGPWRERFAAESGREPPPSNLMVDALGASATALQHDFIYRNPYPLGEKRRLDRVEGSSTYYALHAQLHGVVRSYLEKFGYQDILLIDVWSHQVVYSVQKNIDFGASLESGPIASSSLARVYKAAAAAESANEVFFADYKEYLPRFGQPASFLASPIFEEGEIMAVAVFAIPIERISAIMGVRAGLGDSGESFLVGPDHLMRTDAYHDQEKHSVAGSFRDPSSGSVRTEPIIRALRGETGTIVGENYAGTQVLTAFTPVEVADTRWAMIAEVAEEEAFAAVPILRKEAEAAQASMVTWIAAVVAGAIVLVVLVALWLGRTLSAPLVQTVSVLGDLSHGDLTRRLPVEGNDELAEMAGALNDTIGELSSTLSKLKEMSRDVASSSADVTTSSERMSGDATQTLEAISDSGETITQLSAQIGQNAESAKQAASLVDSVRGAAEAGNTHMQRMASTMSGIEESSQNISQIIRTIDEIAFQTNLLALNAAVEAARAGVHGKGFAVVAEEVRSLAERSSSAASETTRIIDDSAARVQEGISVSKTMEEALTQIFGSACQATELVGQIAVASQDQALKIESVDSNLDQLKQISDRNRDHAGAMTRTAGALQSLAVQTANMLKRFRLAEEGDSSLDPPSTT